MLILLGLQGYQWLKDKVQSEGGKKQQQAKVMDLLPIAHQLGCTVAQLAIGETLPALDPAGVLTSCPDSPKPKTGLSLGRTLFLRDTSEVWVLNCGCSPNSSLSSLLRPQRGVSAARV